MSNNTASVKPITNDLEEVNVAAIKKHSFFGAVSYFLRTIVLQGIGLVSAVVLSGYFSPEDFGVYGFVTQIIGILIFFSDIGLAATLVQKKEEPSQQEYATAFTVQQILAWLIVAIAVIIAATGKVTAKTGPSGFWILLALAISFPLAAFKTIPSIQLERKLQFSKLVIPQIVEQLFFQGVLILLAIKGVGAMAYAYAIIIRSILGLITMYYIQPWKISFHFSKTILKSMLGFGVKFQLNDLLARIKDQLFFVAIGAFVPLKEFGYIQWSKNWSLYPYNLTVQNVMAVTFPTFSRLQHHKELLKKAIEKSVFFISLCIFPILVGMAVFISPLIHLLPVYAKWAPAVISLIFFTLDVAWSAVSTPLINTLNAIGHINETLKIMVIRTILTWVLTPLCFYFFGFNGVAIGTFLINFTSLMPIWYLKKVVDVDIWDATWRQLIAAIVMAVIGFMGLSFWQTSWLHFIVGALISGVSYFGVLLLVDRKKIFTEIQSVIH